MPIDRSLFAALPTLNTTYVKSQYKDLKWLELNEYDFLDMYNRAVIKPLPVQLNNFALGVNVLSRLNTEHHDDNRVGVGGNIRLTYNIKPQWRISADIDFWKTSSEERDTSRHHSPVNPPSPDYNLTNVNLESRAIQGRLGVDYLFKEGRYVQPFVGIGIGYTKNLQDDIEFKYRNMHTTLPIRVRNDDDKNRGEALSLSLRMGIGRRFTKRLGWSVNALGQWDFKSKNNPILGGQFGLTYAL